MMEIELSELTKRFGSTVAVDSVSVTIEQGETFGLIGPSGCGKSTTLRMIAGFETPTDGDIRFNGDSVVDVSPKNRDVGLVFQSIALFKNKNVLKNVTFGPRMRGVSKDERRARAREILEMLDIPELEKRDPKNLSGGQQQRVALGRALAIEPQVLLLDEPMTGLDAKLKRRLQKEMVALFADLDITAIHVTHDQEEAMVMCDRVAVLNEGRIEQVGTPTELYESPKNEFVADFIGTSNLLAANSENSHLDFGFAEIPFNTDMRGDVTVVARPEDFSVGDGDIPVEVTSRFFLGDKVRGYGTLPNGEELVFDMPRQSIEPGDRISVKLDIDKVQVIPEGITDG